MGYSIGAGLTPTALFFAYDGNKHYAFLRGMPDDPNIVPVNSGLINAGYNNRYLADNYFERILFLKLNGLSQNLEAIKRSESSKKHRYVGQTEYLGKKAWEYEWVPGELKNTSLVIFGPQAVVVNYKTDSIPNNKVLAEFSVDELAYYEDIIYPRMGRYTENESKRQYAFTVTAVKKLDEFNNRRNWVKA